MATKKFTGESTRAVMLQIREEFGRDAIVISNRKTDNGIEILATDSLEVLSAQAHTEASKNPVVSSAPARPRRKPPAASADTVSKPQADAPVSAAFGDSSGGSRINGELSEMRNMLEGLARSGSVAPVGNMVELSLTGRLMATGLGADLVQEMLEQLRPLKKASTAGEKTLKMLQKLLAVKPLDFSISSQVVIFHGLAGVGKTLALCKLAASFLAEHSPSKLAIISLRQGHELRRTDGTLEAFSKLLQIPVLALESEHELGPALQALRRKKLVLVDTEALDEHVLFDPSRLIGSELGRRQVEHCLVVSASHQAATLEHLFACLEGSAIQSVVVSRLDETRQPGVVIDNVIRSGLPVAYCVDSAGVHDPLSDNPGAQLLDRLRLQDPSELAGATDSHILDSYKRKGKGRRRPASSSAYSVSSIIG